MPKFTKQEDIAEWLRTAPESAARVFAARVALRALPALTTEFDLHGTQLKGREQARGALRTFRRLQLAWVLSAFPARPNSLDRVVGSVAVEPIEGTTYVERSAAYAVAACHGNNPHEFATVATNYAIEVLGFSRQTFEDMLDACSFDAEKLDQRTSPAKLAHSPIWPSGVPPWAFEAWNELKLALRHDGEHWRVWTDWYSPRFEGRSANQSLEMALASIPNAIWEEPALVNAHIEQLLRQYKQYGGKHYHPLSALNREELAIIGVRVVLRAFPLIEIDGSHFLTALRAISSAWIAATYQLPMDHHTHDNRLYTELLNAPPDVPSISKALLASANSVALSAAISYVIDGIEALHQAASRKDGPEVRLMFEACLTRDLDALRAARSIDTVAELPLWLSADPPEWCKSRWGMMEWELLRADGNWHVWADWYDDRVVGTSRSKAHNIAYIQVPSELWLQGAEPVNTWIKTRIKELGDSAQERIPDELQAFRVPEQKPAAIEPVWSDGKLALPKKPAKTKLDNRKFSAALKSLREEIRALADDIAGEANIDKRVVNYIRILADKIPNKAPRQHELFSLGHAFEVLSKYSKTVAEQWPEFLAARHHGVILTFDRTMRQSPDWCELVRNGQQEVLTTDQIVNSFPLATGLASALRMDEAPDFVDSPLPQALDDLAGPPNEPSDAVIQAGYDLLAYDLIESVNNILKRVAEAALKAKAVAGSVARGVGSTLGETATIWAEEIGKGLKQAARKDGPKTGEQIFKWFKRVVVGGLILKGSAVTLSSLITMYPQAFAWLLPLLRFFQ